MPSSQRSAARQKEYRTLTFGYSDPQRRLNQLAEDGWVVVAPIERDSETWAFLLERDADTTAGGGGPA